MQTVLAVTAIDRLCDSLISEKTGRFCHKLFQVCLIANFACSRIHLAACIILCVFLYNVQEPMSSVTCCLMA